MPARVATFAEAPAPADARAVNGLREVLRERITLAIALTLALTASAAPTAWADQPPLAQAEAAALNHPTRTPASAASCDDVCSGHGYGPGNVSTSTPASPVSCDDVCSGHGYGPVSVPATVVRVLAPSGGFDWGDAGVGAGGASALTMIGLGGTLVAKIMRQS